MVCPDALEKIRKKKIGFISHEGFPKKKIKYNKKKMLDIYHGYDILENLIVVRAFIYKQYGMPFRVVEMILYLFPKQYFTQEDFYQMPKPFTCNRIGLMLEQGHFAIASKGRNKGEHIYMLSRKSKLMVQRFYKLLSGEEKIPVVSDRNVMARKDNSAIDKIRVNLIKKINALPVRESKKALFE